MSNTIGAINNFLDRRIGLVYIILTILGLISYLVNLGLLPLFADEGTRAVVALEMMFSKNYWVPTIHGNFYYSKPPFYNWILISVFNITGSMSEFVFRLPSVIPLFLYGITIFLWVKKYHSKQMAFLSAAMFVTCGRMLIYSSLLGHIDIFYSWITFLGFITLIEGLREENWWLFFGVSYLLAAVAFLCKGLPTLIFQSSSIFILLLFEKKWKVLFHWKHFVGIALFFFLVGGYFLIYSHYNDIDGFFFRLTKQSTSRTIVSKAWYKSIIHLVKFPIDHIMHLAPWSLLVIYLFKKEIWKKIWSDYLLRSSLLIFLINIPVYWMSPGYYPRYLFMLYPFIFILITYAYLNRTIKFDILKYLFILSGAVLILFPIIKFILPIETELTVFQYFTIIALSGIGIFGIIKYKNKEYLGYLLILISFRFLFDWYVLPERLNKSRNKEIREDAIAIGQKTKGERLKVLHWTAINHNSTFYLERERKEIVERSPGIWPNEYHIVGINHIKKNGWEKLDSMSIKFNKREIYLVKPKK